MPIDDGNDDDDNDDDDNDDNNDKDDDEKPKWPKLNVHARSSRFRMIVDLNSTSKMMTHKEDDYGDDDDNDEDVDDDENYQNGHNSANFQARTSKVYMVVDLDNTYTL